MQEGGESGSGNHGREVVTCKHQGNHAIAAFEHPGHRVRFLDAAFMLGAHLESVSGDQRDLAGGEKGLTDDAQGGCAEQQT